MTDRESELASEVVEWRQLYDEACELLEAVENECRRHAHPGCNSGAHELAVKVLRIIRGENHANPS